MRIVWFSICVRTISVRLCMAENRLPECWALGRSVWSTHFDDVTSRFRVEEISTPACRLIRVSYVTHNVTEYCNLIGAQDSCAVHKPMLTLFPDPLSLQSGSGNETSLLRLPSEHPSAFAEALLVLNTDSCFQEEYRSAFDTVTLEALIRFARFFHRRVERTLSFSLITRA